MEILEIPVAEEIDGPPPKLEEQEQDLAAFELWKQASTLDVDGSE